MSLEEAFRQQTHPLPEVKLVQLIVAEPFGQLDRRIHIRRTSITTPSTLELGL